MPLLLIPEYSGINKGQRIPETISLRSFQFVVIYTVKGFNLVSEAEVDVFLECWQFHLFPLPLQNSTGSSGSSWFMYF